MERKQKKMNKFSIIKGKNGITLIALVITIIVLLILAGVTIAALTGDNGLLTKAGNSKGETIKAEGLEKIKLAVVASYDNLGKVETSLLAKNLSQIEGIKYINQQNEEVNVEENTEIKLTAKVKLNGYNYKISDEGKVNYKKEEAIDNEDIMANPLSYYGKYVTNYNSLSDEGINASEGQKWQVFLADDTNIYLIASNAIHKDYAPLNYNTSGDYVMYFSNITSLYDTNIEGNPSVATILGKLNKQEIYHEWLNTPSNLKNQQNQRGVLSMLDTDKWSEYTDVNNKKRGFKNSTYASYVIGGPTIEMFCKSYNITHGGQERIPKPKDDNNEYYYYGYSRQNGTGQTELVSGINSMYFNTNYWLASPSSFSDSSIILILNSWIDDRRTFHNAGCFRPLVCLKSNVHLIEKTNGTTTTYELELD